MKKRISIIIDEAKGVIKPLIGIAALVGGGLVPFLQLITKCLPSSELAIIVAAVLIVIFLSMLCWRLTMNQANWFWFDREYKLLKTQWIYSVNDDNETLDGECTSERELVCIDGEIAHLNVSIGKDESFIPFNPTTIYHQELISFSREGGGKVTIQPPHKNEGASFAFRITFDPPLYKYESAQIKYKYKVPGFKIANLESLRAKMITAKTSMRDYEYNSINVVYPIKRLVYELIFPKQCGVTPLGVEVRRGTTNFTSEERNVKDKKNFKVENNELGCRMILDRERPPMKAGYRVKWKPPGRETLLSLQSGKVAESNSHSLQF